jgi:hypothetical protein
MDLASFILALALAAAGGGSTPPDSTAAGANVEIGAPLQPAPETPPDDPDCRSHIIDLG